MNVDLSFGLVEGFLLGVTVAMLWAARKSAERLRALHVLRERADRQQVMLAYLLGTINSLCDRLGEARGDHAAILHALNEAQAALAALPSFLSEEERREG